LQQQKDSFLKIKEETGRAIMTISAIDRKELDAKHNINKKKTKQLKFE